MMTNHQHKPDVLSDVVNTMTTDQKLDWALNEIEKLKRSLSMPVDVKATDIRIYGMNDNHTFIRYYGTMDAILQKWKKDCVTKGTSLCSVIVLGNGKELRRVGNMLFRSDDTDGISRWISAMHEDMDIMELWDSCVNKAPTINTQEG